MKVPNIWKRFKLQYHLNNLTKAVS